MIISEPITGQGIGMLGLARPGLCGEVVEVGCAGNPLDRQVPSGKGLFPRGKCSYLLEEKMLAKQVLNISPHLQGLYYCSHREFHFLLLGCLLTVTML